MHMEVMDAPAIYYDALTSMMIEESGGTQAAGGYTLQGFRTSVIEGKHPDGDQLSTDMPRWQMSDQDLADKPSLYQLKAGKEEKLGKWKAALPPSTSPNPVLVNALAHRLSPAGTNLPGRRQG